MCVSYIEAYYTVLKILTKTICTSKASISDVPTVDVPLIGYTIEHGNDISLLCTVNAIPLHTKVYWIKETGKGKIVLNHGTTGTIGMTVANPSLSLKPAVTTDSGLYTCFAFNAIGTGISRTITLIGNNV